MAVLVQKVIPSEYAFVIHTKNPQNDDEDEIYIEACLGMGEALVSDMPGSALSFTYNKKTGDTKVLNFPSKKIKLISEGFIFRSDSNAEDLDDFAGAGLFDSHTMSKTEFERISYTNEKLVNDEAFLQEFM